MKRWKISISSRNIHSVMFRYAEKDRFSFRKSIFVWQIKIKWSNKRIKLVNRLLVWKKMDYFTQ